MCHASSTNLNAASGARSFRRVLSTALVVGLLIMLVRGAAIVHATNETWDENEHILLGLLSLTNARHATPVPHKHNDPPFGAMLVAFPVWLAGGTVTGVPTPQRPEVYAWPERPLMLWSQQYSPDTLRHLIAAWKCLLMLPGLAAAFLWARALYGAVAGWLAWGLYLSDPTIAAMTPVATPDSLAVSLGLAAAYFVWRFINMPTLRCLLPASLLAAAALLTKHTAVVLPVFAVVASLVVWTLRRDAVQQPGNGGGLASEHPPGTASQAGDGLAPRLRRRGRAAMIYAARLLAAAALTIVFCWPLTKFDVSPPAKVRGMSPQMLEKQTPYWEMSLDEWKKLPIPLGGYIGSFSEGRRHNERGHPGYLWGEGRRHGWWYYFPVVMLYKAPAGHLAVIVLGLLSFVWRRPRLEEVPLWIALACWWGLMLVSHINIGWRHALLPYALLLVAATRCCMPPAVASAGHAGKALISRVAVAGALLALLSSVLHVALWHPNYIPYINWPRQRVYLQVSDSNVDWGQAAKQVGKWLEEHRGALPEPIYYSRFGPAQPVKQYVKDARGVDRELPSQGTLIISPVNVAGVYARNEHFAPLRDVEPVAVIAQTMLVYDLSKVPRD